MKITIKADVFADGGGIFGHTVDLDVPPRTALRNISNKIKSLGHWQELEAPKIIRVDDNLTCIVWGNDYLAAGVGPLTDDSLEAALAKTRATD